METVEIPTYRRHSTSAFIPQDDKAIMSLTESMSRLGFLPQFPIILATDERTDKDAIIDGWHRYQAAKASGVMPEFKNVRDLGLTEEAAIRAYAVAANVSRRQMNSKKAILALLRSGLKGLDEATLMTMTGASSGTARGGRNFHDLLPRKTQQGIIDGTVSIGDADEMIKKRRGTKNTHRAPKVAPPALPAVVIGEMEMAQRLEKADHGS